MRENITASRLRDPHHLNEAFRLRYQIYCHKRHFMDASDYPDGCEIDDLDKHAAHFGVFDHNTRLIGFSRLILPSCDRFPVEQHGGVVAAGSVAQRRHCAEISRFMISQSCGPQIDEMRKVHPATRRIGPVFFALYKAMREECRQQDIRYCFAFMERTLWYLTRLYGFEFVPVGPEVNFYGLVRAYRLDVGELEKQATPHRLLEINSNEPCFA